MNAPIKYFGGKGTMFNKIIEHHPEKGSYNTYIEPFGGSYSMGLKMEDIPNEIYNDLESNVYSLYSVLSIPEEFERFKVKCQLTLYSEQLRDEYRLALKGDLSKEERAFMFYYVNRTSHNGIGGFSLNTVVRRKMCKSVSDFLSSVDRLDELHQRLSKVAILNRDGISLIEKYNLPNTFIYCDPPYHWSTRTSARYKVDMNDEGHIRFMDACINSKAKILISGYKCDVYNHLEQNGFNRIDFEVKTIDGNHEKKTKVESLWKNY
jgi:DNA adenine methylase